MTEPSPALQTRILALIALFEGSANGGINTWDEQLLSCGVLHFAVGQGTGVRYLRRIYQLDPAGTLSCLGPAFTAALKAGDQAVVAFCRAHVHGTGQKWVQAFRALARLQAAQQADMEFAQPYLDAGVKIAQRYGLVSERGLAWAVDRCVQQGGNPRPYVDQVYGKVKGQAEPQVMEALTRAYADTANPKYRHIVLTRSLTVARGSSVGTGYQGRVNLDTGYGISLTRPWAAQEEVTPGVPRVFMRAPGPDGKNVEWKAGDRYGGHDMTPDLFAQLALVTPKGKSSTYANLKVTRAADGALLLDDLNR